MSKMNLFLVALSLFALVRCGGNAPQPGPTPNPDKTFVVTGKFLEVKGVAKSADVGALKAAVVYAVRSLEE